MRKKTYFRKKNISKNYSMLSNSSKYAINAVLYIAIHSSELNKIGVKEIAEKLGIPFPFLAKILQSLARKNAISSTKGPGGGFWLTDKEKSASLMSIIDKLDEIEKFTSCSMSLKECSERKPCPIHHAIQPFKQELKKQLTENTIAYFAQKVIDKEAFLFM